MALSKQQMQAWALGRIEAAFPPSESMSAIDDLYRVRPFFSGESALLFGMKTTPDAFEEPVELVERSKAGLRAWFDHFGNAGDTEQQAKLYYVVKAGDPTVAEPEFVGRKREAAEAFESAKCAALAKLPRPIEAVAQVSKSLAAALTGARGVRPDNFFAQHGSRIAVDGEPSPNWKNFDWLSPDPEWEELVGASFDAPFFPFAGADGDYVGVLVLDAANEAPVVYFSHEEGFFFVAQTLEQWNTMCDEAAATARGAKRKPRKAQGREAALLEEQVKSSTAYDGAFAAARVALEGRRPP